MEVKSLPIDRIIPNRWNPREEPEKDIEELVRSIREHGLIIPITVRPLPNGYYEIVTGYRRYLAYRKLGLKEIPCIIKDLSDAEAMIESLIENVHRKDLKPVEKARFLAKIYEIELRDQIPSFSLEFVAGKLKTIEDKVAGRSLSRLSDVELKIKRIADKIGLSYDYQYRLLTILRLSEAEIRRLEELGVTEYEILSTVATIPEEYREKVIELVPRLDRSEVKKLSKLIKSKEVPEEMKHVIIKYGIRPTVAEKILQMTWTHEETKEVLARVVELKSRGIEITTDGVKEIVEDVRIERAIKYVVEKERIERKARLFEDPVVWINEVGEKLLYLYELLGKGESLGDAVDWMRSMISKVPREKHHLIEMAYSKAIIVRRLLNNFINILEELITR